MHRIKVASLAGTVCGFLLIAFSAQDARATLVSENIGGAQLIFDTLTGTTWTQDGNLSGDTFTYQDANTWAGQLTTGGLNWELPTATQFTSLFTQLDPYGPPGTESDKYGASVAFGAGPNDEALNVQGTYWTNTDSIDFNFFYGYGGSEPDSNTYAAWAVETPEPSAFGLLFAGLLALVFVCIRRNARPAVY